MSFSSGLRELDEALGEGPLSPGSMLLIRGDTDTAKTALALWFCRTAQAADPEAHALWLGTEAPLGPASLAWAGVDPERLLIGRQVPPLSAIEVGVQTLEACRDRLPLRVVVLDSLSGLLALESPEESRSLAEISRTLLRLYNQAQQTGALLLLLAQQRHGAHGCLPAGLGSYYRCLSAEIQLCRREGLYQAERLAGYRIEGRVRVLDDEDLQLRSVRFNCWFDRGLRDLRRVGVQLPGKSAPVYEVGM